MVASGMRDAGYIYVNIDGGWEGYRDAEGVLHPNKNFPDMKALGDYIHSKRLKFGIYSGPGPGYICRRASQLWPGRTGRQDVCFVGRRLREV